MKDQKVNHSEKRSKNKKNAGFYIALGLCIVAIGGAAWTTYSSVLDYQTPKEESSASGESSAEEKETGRTVSGIEYSAREDSSMPSVNTESSVTESSAEEPENEISVDIPAEISSGTEPEIVKPIDGEVIKGFSAENPVYSKTMGDWRVHEGIDIAADDGEQVRAYTDGTVSSVYNDELLGYSVKIEHTDGITMTYSGLSPTVLVNEGDKVTAGDYIGAVFTVPSEIMDKTHLHLTAEKNGEIIDAQAILEQQ